WTTDDWVDVTVHNDDTAAHTLTLSDSNTQVQIGAGGDADQVLHLQTTGDFTLKDQPSGATAPYSILATPLDTSTTAPPTTSAAHTPGLGASALIALVVLGALWRRRV
ncbi:MAG: hypothetical protein ACYDBQ_11235, partial [Thermoplasmatota archaeon]